MTRISKWASELIERLNAIYAPFNKSVVSDQSLWEKAIEGLNGQQIKHALAHCKENKEIVITSELFRELALNETPKDVSYEVTHKEDNPTPHEEVGYYMKLGKGSKMHSEQLSSHEERMIAMSDTEAIKTLTHEEQYDRCRLLLQRMGHEQVQYHQRMTQQRLQDYRTPIKKRR